MRLTGVGHTPLNPTEQESSHCQTAAKRGAIGLTDFESLRGAVSRQDRDRRQEAELRLGNDLRGLVRQSQMIAAINLYEASACYLPCEHQPKLAW
jgi:hypothetical protein